MHEGQNGWPMSLYCTLQAGGPFRCLFLDKSPVPNVLDSKTRQSNVFYAWWYMILEGNQETQHKDSCANCHKLDEKNHTGLIEESFFQICGSTEMTWSHLIREHVVPRDIPLSGWIGYLRWSSAIFLPLHILDKLCFLNHLVLPVHSWEVTEDTNASKNWSKSLKAPKPMFVNI